MPKGSKKRAKLKKQQQQQGHPDDAGNTHAASNGNGNGSDDNNHNNAASSGRDGDHRHHHLRIPPKASRVDVSEDSMESSEEMVTPRAAASEPDEEERKATAAEVPVESAVEADVAGSEEVMVDAFPSETAAQQEGEGKVDEAEVEVHAVVAQEPEVKDVLVAEESVVQEPVADAPAVEASEVKKEVVQEPLADAPSVEASEVKKEVVQEPVADAPVVEASEVKKEVAKVHPVLESEPKVDDVVVVEETPVPPEVQEPEVKGASATVLLKEPETNSGNVVAKDFAEVSRSQEAVDVHTTEVARGPAVASPGQRATWWNCCGLFDAFSGSGR